MLPRWTLLILVCLLVDFGDVECAKYSPSRSSSSNRSRGYSSGGSRSGASHGSYGWKTTRRPVYTTRRSVYTTQRPIYTTRRYEVTTHKPFTRWTQHYVTTRPTQRSTRGVFHTTMPTHRTTTRQPPYNPHYPPSGRHNNSVSHSTRQPPYNPFFATKIVRHNSSQLHATTRQPPHNPFFTTKSIIRHNSSQLHATTRQPAYNPFFTTKPPVRQNSSQLHATTRQPPYNPFFSTKPPVRHNSSQLHATTGQPPHNPFYTTSHTTIGKRNNSQLHQASTRQPPYNPSFSTKSTGRTNGSNWHVTPAPRPSHNNTGNGNLMTPRPGSIYTTRIVPNNSGFNNWRYNNSRPPINNGGYMTSKPKFTAPSWNRTSPHGTTGTSSHGVIYRPPGRHNTTISTRPNYITGTHPNYNQHTNHPTGTGTTIINNNNHHYHPGGGYYQPSTGSTSHVTIINNNNFYHPNHHVILPSRHYYGYGPPAVGITVVNTDYYHPISPHYVTTYHYSPMDTGSSTLGFFLGYQLGRISRPSYYYHSTSYVNNEYVPRYDHYTVHHYYHNSQSIPKESPIQPNAIVVCPGDSGTICPPGNMPLCTNNGAVMCVVSAQSTVPCSDNIQNNCVNSTISCSGNSSPNCQNQNSTPVSIPCVSTAKIDAGVEFVNNSVVVVNANDVSTKSFCVTVVAIPDVSKNATKNTTLTLATPMNYSLPFRYTTNDTGVGLLAYYLADRLQNLSEPSYSYLNYDNNYNYIEKYDHYNVFHYDHDPEVLSKEVEIQSDQLMKCAGDSGTFCPQNSTSLCLNDGGVICAAEFTSAIYSPQLGTSYVISNISCNSLKSPACISTPNDTITIQIPCISTAKVYANTTYMIQKYGVGSNVRYYKTLEPMVNGSTVVSSTTPRDLCVIILALPGERIVMKAPKRRRTTGLPNTSEALSLPKYTYTINETGNDVLGHYLARRLSTLSFPSYYYINALLYESNGDIQKYDHYSVHHYGHGREILPTDLELQASEIRGCEGDSGLICPFETNSVCLNDGSVWCITDQMVTEACIGFNNTMCVKTQIPCKNNDSPLCKNVKIKEVHLPCMATLTISGNIMAINNTIYKSNILNAKSYTDIQMIPGSNNYTSKAEHFCVTIVNIPVERNVTVGEKIFESSDSIFGNIVSRIFA